MASQVNDFIARVVQNLPEMPPDIMQSWIENPKALQNFLAGLCQSETAKTDFPLWRTLKLGTSLKSAGDFRSALKQNGDRISEWANNLLGRPGFIASAVSQTVNLVICSVSELGFKPRATYQQICQRAQELGLQLCPAEVGPQLRLQYQDQPFNEELIIAMEPISGSHGDLRLFNVARYGSDLWLLSNDGRPDYFWFDDYRFVFVLRKPDRPDDNSRSGG